LHMKNPKALAMKDKIVKVSVLNQRKRCDTGAASHIGLTTCITTPSSHASKPYKNNSSPATLATRIFLSKALFICG
ncbi:MAG: hypothetical protein NT043_03585, partial [Candidatus Bathyarchaeota archaeon]|nr:hypothetical protein [Candidatus Bathyarchaeota archaeon]